VEESKIEELTGIPVPSPDHRTDAQIVIDGGKTAKAG